MRVTIDSAGRIVIPKSIRDLARLHAGSSLDLSFRGGSIVLEPLPLEVEVVSQGGVWVAQPLSAVESLSTDLVEEALDAIRGRGH